MRSVTKSLFLLLLVSAFSLSCQSIQKAQGDGGIEGAVRTDLINERLGGLLYSGLPFDIVVDSLNDWSKRHHANAERLFFTYDSQGRKPAADILVYLPEVENVNVKKGMALIASHARPRLSVEYHNTNVVFRLKN